jgi:predicted ferric reductase
MERKKAPLFISIIAIILGVTLFKQFDFENLRFKHTGLAIVYLIVFIISIYFLIRDSKFLIRDPKSK